MGEVDRPLVEILERQLERLADHDDERKVRILTTLVTSFISTTMLPAAGRTPTGR